jgi:hypothetical protein
MMDWYMHLDAYCQTCYHAYHPNFVAYDLTYHAYHSTYCACLVFCHAYPLIHHLYGTCHACQMMHHANDLAYHVLALESCCACVLESCHGMHVWTNRVTHLWGPCLSVQLACALPCHERSAHASLMLQRKVALRLLNHWNPIV